MSPAVKILIGFVAAMLMGWAYHGPLGQGEAFVGALEAQAQQAVAEVPGVQAIGMAVSWIGRGVTMRTDDRSIDQPRPKAKPSRWTLVRPHSRNLASVHSSAARICGELDRRGPITSVRCCAVNITWLWLLPSSMIRFS